MPEGDSWLVRRAAHNDAAAFEEIVKTHQQGIYRVVLGITGNHYDADDLTQETFIRAHRELAGFRQESSLRTWLTRIALNCARDHLRRQRVRAVPGLGRQEESVADPAAISPEARLMSRQLGEAVDGFVTRQLSEREREIFNLRFAGGLRLEEIAEVTGANLSTVKTHLYRALAKAKRSLAGEGAQGERRQGGG